jgi:hypothetical protein
MPLTRPALSLGTAGGGHTQTSWPPSSENNLATVPDEAMHGRNDFRAAPVRAAGKAAGHAVGKLTLRHDLAARARFVLSPEAARIAGRTGWPQRARYLRHVRAGRRQCRTSDGWATSIVTTCLLAQLQDRLFDFGSTCRGEGHFRADDAEPSLLSTRSEPVLSLAARA